MDSRPGRWRQVGKTGEIYVNPATLFYRQGGTIPVASRFPDRPAHVFASFRKAHAPREVFAIWAKDSRPSFRTLRRGSVTSRRAHLGGRLTSSWSSLPSWWRSHATRYSWRRRGGRSMR